MTVGSGAVIAQFPNRRSGAFYMVARSSVVLIVAMKLTTHMTLMKMIRIEASDYRKGRDER